MQPPPAPDGWRHARVLVVVAHPDDEVLGCGALLAELADVTVIHVTDGAPRDGADAARLGFATPAAYAAARRGEAEAALQLAGVPPSRLTCLGIADQEAPAHMASIARRLVEPITAADVVLSHAFEGGHGDHDAVAFAVRAAHGLGPGGAELVEMPFYHAGPQGWVRQRFLPTAHLVCRRNLSAAARALKARMVAAHASQGETLQAFALDAELFRVAPEHDFTRRPHDRPLLYEQHGWNLTWPCWDAAVRDATAALGLPA